MKDKKEISEIKKDIPNTNWREVIIKTDGNNIVLVKSECSALELITILRELLKKIRRPLK